jgi:hypothetical protein
VTTEPTTPPAGDQAPATETTEDAAAAPARKYPTVYAEVLAETGDPLGAAAAVEIAPVPVFTTGCPEYDGCRTVTAQDVQVMLDAWCVAAVHNVETVPLDDEPVKAAA